MNAPLRQQLLLRPGDQAQQELALATDGVLRLVWQHRFGAMLIEVQGGRVFVNGQPVEPAEPAGPAPGGQGPAASSTRLASS
jgi:hypothetical protein